MIQAARIAAVLTLLISPMALAQRSYPPKLPGARVEVYKTIGDVQLNAYIFLPKDHSPKDKRAAIVFFFGGGWRAGSPAQFHQHCLRLAKRGMVAITADYRVATRHKTKALACVADAKSAIRWVRQEADKLGVDPNKIVAAGGSAGGHIAACTGVIDGLEEAGEAVEISSRPNAMALFNPALVLAPVVGAKVPFDAKRLADLKDRIGADPKTVSPFHHVRAGVPPTIIFHGQADKTVPYLTAELFTKAVKKNGGRCQLEGYPDQPHGFFNYGRSENKPYLSTMEKLERFLESLGYLATEEKERGREGGEERGREGGKERGREGGKERMGEKK